MDKPSFLHRLFDSMTRTAGGQSRSAAKAAQRAVELCQALLSERGEVSGARIAREALGAYESLDEAAVEAFFDLLADEFSPDPDQVNRAAEAYGKSPTQANLVRLQRAVESPRASVFQ